MGSAEGGGVAGRNQLPDLVGQVEETSFSTKLLCTLPHLCHSRLGYLCKTVVYEFLMRKNYMIYKKMVQLPRVHQYTSICLVGKGSCLIALLVHFSLKTSESKCYIELSF